MHLYRALRDSKEQEEGLAISYINCVKTYSMKIRLFSDIIFLR